MGDVVERGTAYDPDDIAEAYVELHQQAPDAWKQEMLFDVRAARGCDRLAHRLAAAVLRELGPWGPAL